MKQLLMLCLLFGYIACEENKSVDPTILPEITATGENTFGCLVDGWVYTGGRKGMPTVQYVRQNDTTYMKVSAKVGFDSYIHFTIVQPEQGKTTDYTCVEFDNQYIEDGMVSILRMDNGIFSGTFEGKRITKGRFDLKYKE